MVFPYTTRVPIGAGGVGGMVPRLLLGPLALLPGADNALALLAPVVLPVAKLAVLAMLAQLVAMTAYNTRRTMVTDL